MAARALRSTRWRERPPLVAVLVGLTAAIDGPDARASAWNRPAGTGLLIWDFSLGAGTDYFDGKGRLAPARAYAKDELSAYVEYGATDWLTLVARPSLDRVSIGAPDAGHYAGLGTSSAGAQLQVAVFGPAVLAVQGTFSQPGSNSRHDPPQIGNTAREADLRVLGGVGFSLGPYPAFIDAQGSFRMRSAGAASQWHGDLTFGVAPTPRALVLIQNFTTVPTGPGSDYFPSSRYSKLEISGVYWLTPVWAVQVGTFATVYGRNALRERGFSAGIWHKF